MEQLRTEVLVVGGGTGGTAAALQAARRGAKTLIVSEFPWLGGMLTAAGVSAVDGNELAAFQTGIWRAFLQELQQRQPQGLDNGWVSFFTFNPRLGAEIFADWVRQQPNLRWISGSIPKEVLVEHHQVVGVRFADFTVFAEIIVDATELGDLLALAAVTYRWGWELKSQWQEPSAPVNTHYLSKLSPVQAPTWVILLKDYGKTVTAPQVPPPPNYQPQQFTGAWENHGVERFLSYGGLGDDSIMINWPCEGNDYGEKLQRLIESETSRQALHQEMIWHSQSFAYFIQTQLGRRYGLATGIFPAIHPQHLQFSPNTQTAFALHPYYRESRRLQGITTITELDILPMKNSQVAALPCNQNGECDTIAIGNYINDHHYTQGSFPLQPKSIRWGGRWTGTPFTIPYRAIIPKEIDGLLVADKNISVSHIANGATRLQPVVLGIGQAAGMAAALCIELNCQPRDLPVSQLQTALLTDKIAPAAIIPLFNLPPSHPEWLNWQQYYLQHPEAYPTNGHCPVKSFHNKTQLNSIHFAGIFRRHNIQDYSIKFTEPMDVKDQVWKIVTLQPSVNQFLENCNPDILIKGEGRLNDAGGWLIIESVNI
ncbi:MAG: FAD-dependent oxidoreductase [Microcoleaceae cyanobacterium]